MKKKKKKNKMSIGGIAIGFQLIIFGLYFAFIGWSVDYILNWFGKDIPFIGDFVIGIFAGSVTIPVAVVGWILQLFGIF